MTRWEFWIDRGGTFTDVIGRSPQGELHTLKLLSENSAQYDDAAVEGIRRILKLRSDESISPAQVACVKMGTTVATNALLERKGSGPCCDYRGFRDALRIATQGGRACSTVELCCRCGERVVSRGASVRTAKPSA